MLIAFILVGCTKEVPLSSVHDIVSKSEKIATYDPKDLRLTLYSVQKNGSNAKLSYAIVYMPLGETDMFYTPLSPFYQQIQRLDHEAKTLPELLEGAVKSAGEQKLFADKQEYIIDYSVAREAFDIVREIEKIQSRDDSGDDQSGSGEIILPD